MAFLVLIDLLELCGRPIKKGNCSKGLLGFKVRRVTMKIWVRVPTVGMSLW
jgi:hypothetical protein